MYRPERVQFYCIAASGPQLAALNDLPHVAAVAALHDTEGVTRLLATVRGIVEELMLDLAENQANETTWMNSIYPAIPHPRSSSSALRTRA